MKPIINQDNAFSFISNISSGVTDFRNKVITIKEGTQDALEVISQFCKIHPRGLQDRKEPRLSIISCSQPVLSNIKQINKSMQSGLSGSQFPNPKGKIPINVLPKMKPNTTEKNTLLPSHISSATCQRHLNKSMPCIFHHKIESSMGQQCLVSSKPVGLSMRQKHSSRCYTGS